MPAAPLLYSKQYQDETASLWRNEPLLGAAEQDSDALVRRTLSLVRNLPTTGESDVCVMTIATDLYNSSSESGAALLQNKIDFCEACGYRCLIHTRGEHATHRPHKWDKILALHDAMRTCNIVLYVDADVVFRRAFQLPPLTRSWLAGSKDFVGINSGVLLVVRSKVALPHLQGNRRISLVISPSLHGSLRRAAEELVEVFDLEVRRDGHWGGRALVFIVVGM